MYKIIFLSLLLMTYSLQASKLEKVSLQLNWKFQFEFAGFIVAKEKGFYRDVGIDLQLKEFEQGTVVVNDVLENRVDFGVSDSAVILKSIQGEPIVGLMTIFQHSPFILLGLKSSGIKVLEDLNDKKIAMLEDIDGVTILSMLKANNIKYKPQPKVFNFDELISREIDMISAYATNEVFVAKEKDLDIIIFNPKDYGFDSYGDILLSSKETIKKHPKMVQHFYDATKRGWEYAFENIDETVELIFNKYNTLEKSKEALLFEAEALKEISGHGKNFGELKLEKLKAISNLYTFLISNKYDIDNLNNFIYEREENDTLLTKEEKEYLKNNTFTYAGDPNWLPFEAFDDKGKYIGIISEHVDIIEKKLNLKFKKIVTKDWLETLELSKKVGVDIISGDAADVVLSKNYKPIDTYMKNPLVMVTRDDYLFISDLNDLKDKKIAYTNGGGYTADIVKKYPDIEFIVADTIYTGLFGVKSGKYDIFIGTLSMVDYSIVSMGLEGIKISGDADIIMNLTLFVDKDKPRLYSIMNKTMNSISDIQKHKIIAKWRHSKIDRGVVDYTLVWQIVGLFLFLFFIGLVFVFILKNNNKKLHQLLNSAMESVTIFKNGKVLNTNNISFDMFGYSSAEDMKNKRALEFVHSSQYEILKKQLEKSHKPYELLMMRKDGTTFPGLVQGTQIDDNIRITTVIDITELKETQKELEILNSSLEDKVKEELKKNIEKEKLMLHQSRLAQMGEMISMIAHQWRQPLNNLSMINQSVKMKYLRGKLDDEFIEYFNVNSNKQIQNMSKTIDDFRDFFKPEKEKIEFYLNDVILDILSMVKPIFSKEQILIQFDEEKKYKIYGYPNELGQAILNIMNNAKDALVENDIENKNIFILLKRDDTDVILTIKDNAGGIPTDLIDKIFDPYFSTKEEKNGTGLGLYMTKIIIEEHMNAKIDVFNKDNGAIFEIKLKGSSNALK